MRKPKAFARDLTAIARAYSAGRLNRRAFLRYCALAGLACSSPYLLSGCKNKSAQTAAGDAESLLGPQSAMTPGTDQYHFLSDVGRSFSGTKLRVVSEDTPPSQAIKKLIEQEFTPLTGIEVEWELIPLDRALARILSDVGQKSGGHDIFYLDQAWVANFAMDCTPVWMLLQNQDLLYPGYALDDLLLPLMEHGASSQSVLIGIPFDIPIFIMMYRRDIFDDLNLKVPTTLSEYLEVVRAINETLAPQVYGTTAQWKSGHYGLECHMTAWLWGHGGSIFDADLKPTINDERAHAAMEYMLNLGRYMPPGVTTWDWQGEAASFAQGLAGVYLSWGEFFPSFDDPVNSQIAGLAEAALCPRPDLLRSAADCGFGEVPGIGHQGGSCLAVSRYSRHQEAAWILLQWATSPDITVRSSLLGGGANPVRQSNYSDPRVLRMNKPGPGTTRHFDVTLQTILKDLGSEPHYPGWASLATDCFAVELGKLTTGQQGISETLDTMASVAKTSF